MSPSYWPALSQTNKVSGKIQLSRSFDSWMVRSPVCTNLGYISQLRWLIWKATASLIFGLRGELKGVCVAEIIRVRHLEIKILCQPINMYECVVSDSPIPQFPCVAGWELLGPGDNISPMVHFFLAAQRSIYSSLWLIVQEPMPTFLTKSLQSDISSFLFPLKALMNEFGHSAVLESGISLCIQETSRGWISFKFPHV